MSHQTLSARNRAQARYRVAAALVILACPIALAAPASAEPRPWHNPEYVAEASVTGGQCDQQVGHKVGEDSWATRSKCPVRTTVSSQPSPTKALIEYEERLALASQPSPNKAQIEYEERLALASAR